MHSLIMSAYFRLPHYLGVDHRIGKRRAVLVAALAASQAIGIRFRQANPWRSRYTVEALAPREGAIYFPDSRIAKRAV